MYEDKINLALLRPSRAFVKGFFSIFLVLIFFCSPAMGEVIKVTHTVKQTFGGGQSPDDARISAMAKAKKGGAGKSGDLY